MDRFEIDEKRSRWEEAQIKERFYYLLWPKRDFFSSKITSLLCRRWWCLHNNGCVLWEFALWMCITCTFLQRFIFSSPTFQAYWDFGKQNELWKHELTLLLDETYTLAIALLKNFKGNLDTFTRSWSTFRLRNSHFSLILGYYLFKKYQLFIIACCHVFF